MRVAINGFGRIGRNVFKALLGFKDIKVVAINDLTEPAVLAHLLAYDSVYGKYDKKVYAKADKLIVGNKVFKILAEKNPRHLPWKGMEVDVVLECTGLFRAKKDALQHIKAGAKKVIISAPAKGDDNVKTIVLGVNEEKMSKNDRVVSMASCTTNCLAPVMDVIKSSFGIEKSLMTTIHAYTAGQNIVDGPNKDMRRARAAAINIVPTTTGAAIAVTKAITSLKDKFDGMAIRVPVPVGSISDVVVLTKKKVDEKKVNLAFKKASKSLKLKNILEATMEPLVSTDIIGNPASAIVDMSLTKVVDGNLLKVVAWYDNEWGYSNRMAELCEYIRKKRLV